MQSPAAGFILFINYAYWTFYKPFDNQILSNFLCEWPIFYDSSFLLCPSNRSMFAAPSGRQYDALVRQWPPIGDVSMLRRVPLSNWKWGTGRDLQSGWNLEPHPLMWKYVAYVTVCCLCDSMLLIWQYVAYVTECCLCDSMLPEVLNLPQAGYDCFSRSWIMEFFANNYLKWEQIHLWTLSRNL